MAGSSRILVVAATQKELSALHTSDKITYLVAGVGPAATAVSLARAIVSHRPDVVIQIGIAGAISHDIELIQTVYVVQDKYGDMGVWRDEHFTSFDSSIYKSDFRPVLPYQTVSGVTVSTACSPFADRVGAHVETMEGAAFYQTAQAFGVDAIQVRSISNYINTPRPNWRIEEAIASLAPALDVVLDSLGSRG